MGATASAGCHNNGAGGHKTPNPSYTDYGNPFDKNPFGFDMSGDLQRALSNFLYSAMAQMGSLAVWIIGIYVLTALAALMLLWFYALLRYYRDVTRAVLVGFSWKLPSHPSWRILLALLICIGSLVISPISAVLWPLWIPMLVYQVVLWALNTLLWLLRGTFYVCLCCAKKLARLDPLLFYKPWLPAPPAPQPSPLAAHNHFTQMGDTVVQVHRENHAAVVGYNSNSSDAEDEETTTTTTA